MDLSHKAMNFKVVGFCKKGISFNMWVASQNKITIDNFIMYPHISFNYLASDEDEKLQHTFITYEKLEGYIAIDEPIRSLNIDSTVKYKKT